MTGCILWQGPTNEHGYGRVFFGGSGNYVYAHRLAWEREHGPIPAELCVLHRCDMRACVNPAHLFLGTRTENSQDMVGKGRSQQGEQHTQARLTEADVLAIRADGRRLREVAADHGVDPSTISRIKSGQRWAHV